MQAAETQLSRIQRCKDGPLWVISDVAFDTITLKKGGALPAVTINSGDPGVLYQGRANVPRDFPTGDPVYLLVEDLLENDDWRMLNEERAQAAILRESEGRHSGRRIRVLQYRFDPVLFGRPMNFKFRFLFGGVKYTHLYSTVHGCRELNRISPPIAVENPRYTEAEDMEFM
jgi:hypothetical protein